MKNYLKIIVRVLSFLLLFSLLFNLSYALKPIIQIDEESRVKSVGDGKYSLTANGVIQIKNPSQISRIYEVNIPLQLDSLIGINKLKNDATSDSFTFSFNRIKAYLIDPGKTVKVGYQIYGILNSDITNQTKDIGVSVLEHYAQSFDLSSNTIINLEKVERGGVLFNDSAGQERLSEPAGNTSRLVVANIRNPTDYDYYVNELKIYTTNAADPMFSEGDLLRTFSNITVEPYGLEEINIFATFADP